MRVSWEQRFQTAESGIQRLQQRIVQAQQRLAIGKRITSPADDPIAYSRACRLQELREQTERRLSLLEAMSQESQLLQAHTEALSTTLQEIQRLLTQALDPKGLDKPALLAQQLRQRFDDVLVLANAHINGRYLFGGMKTHFPDGGGPFLLHQGLATPGNPSGLSVEFRGNLAERQLELFPGQVEVLALRADEVFGAGGTELFTVLIAAYNLLAYRADGSSRSPEESLSAAEQAQVEALLPQLATLQARIDRATAQAASRQERWGLLRQLLQEYATQLRAFQSTTEDADIVQLSLELQQAQVVLQALLQTSTRFLQLSFFDFL